MRIPLVLGDAGQFRQQPGWRVATLSGTTDDKDTWVTLLEEGQPLVVPPNTTWLFDAWVVGRAVSVSEDAGLNVSGVIVRNGTATPYIVDTKKTTIARSEKSMKADAVEDVLNNALAIQVRGIKDGDVNWVARVEVAPITG